MIVAGSDLEKQLELSVEAKEGVTKTLLMGLDELGFRKYANAHSKFDIAVLVAQETFELEDFLNLFQLVFDNDRDLYLAEKE